MADWYVNEGKDNDVVLSTKACIVRNIKGYNFLPRLDDKECQSLMETIDGVIDKDKYMGGCAASMDKDTVIRLIRLQVLGREGSQMVNPQPYPSAFARGPRPWWRGRPNRQHQRLRTLRRRPPEPSA